MPAWYFETGNPPYLANQSPPPGASGQDWNVLISFDVVDAESYVDGYDAYVDGVLAWDSSAGSFLAPYDGPGSSISSVIVDGYDGYHVTIDKTSPYDADTSVLVRVVADDYGGNLLDESWSFTTAESSPPQLTNRSPAPGSIEVSAATLISFDIYDEEGDIDGYDAYVDGAFAWSNTLGFISPYDGPASAVTSTLVDGYDGYNIVIDRTTPFYGGSTVSVRAVVLDSQGGSLDETWQFTIETGPTPEIANETPAPYSTDVDPLALMSVDIFDRDNNLDNSSVEVRVNGALGFDADGGGFLPAFAGAGATAYPTTVDGYDGYHIQLKPTLDLANFVTVQVSGQDAYGSTGGGSWSFSVFGATRNFIYYSDGYGVYRIHMSDFAGESQDAAVKILSAEQAPFLGTNDVATLSGQAKDGYMYLLTSMRAPGGVLVTRNEVNDPRYYLDGYDAYGAQMSERGIMYVLNKTLNRVEVYYGADFRTGSRTPDFVYDSSFPNFIDGTLLDLYVASGFSDVRADSDRLYVASTTGFARIDTYEVETVDGYSDGMDGYGMCWTYGVNGSGKDYEAIGDPLYPQPGHDTASQVVAIHADDAAGIIYAATDDGQGNGGLTQILLSANRRIFFMNQSNGFLPTNYLRDVHGKNS